jgi:sulfate-transporting ATPase
VTTFIQYLLLGLGLGAGYSLMASGLVVIQRGSGVINFAQGAMAMLGGFVFYQVKVQEGWTLAPAFAFAVVFTAAVGALIYHVVMRPLRDASALSKVVATLGLLITIEAAALLYWHELPRTAPGIFPTDAIKLGGGLYLGQDKLIMTCIAAGITVVLWAAYRWTLVGMAITASAESERGASTLGWSPHALAMLSWALGGALAAVAGVLISAVTVLQVEGLTLLLIPTLAAALAGGFVSFPMTFAGAIVIGMTQSLVANYFADVRGLASSLPFLVIIVFLVIRGKSLPVRGATSTVRLPELGTGRIRWGWLLPLAGVWLVLTYTVWSEELVVAATRTVAWAIILLSVVVLMGYAGQIDLAPLAWGGIAAMVAGRLVKANIVPFEIAILIGVLGAIPVGILFGIPALRARGLNLAVVTLGLGLVVHDIIFANTSISDAPDGIGLEVGPQSIFGISIDGFLHPERYFTFVFVVFIALAILVANARRGRVGRRLIAVRTNEQAAAALGISVFGSKLYAFSLSATVAALGGIMLGFESSSIDLFAQYDPVTSMKAATDAVIGGVGFLVGPLFGGQLANGGVGQWALHAIWPSANNSWLFLISGLAVILILLQDPNGLVSMNIKAAKASPGQNKLAYLRLEVLILKGWAVVRQAIWKPEPKQAERLPEVRREDVRLDPATLRVDDLTVRYGGVTAVSDVSLEVKPGKILGLIGPNGAGKTSLIDAVTGFTLCEGSITLDGRPMQGYPVYKRAQFGIVRSFQNLQLFEGSTIRENVMIAADRRDWHAYFTDLVAPGRTRLTPLTVIAVQELGLEDVLELRPSDVSYGSRRLVGIARAVSMGPRVLLLDEPAAGLSAHESRELAHIVRRLADEFGLGILLVEHDMHFVMGICDEITVLDFGRQIASGTPEEIRGNPAVIAAYLGSEDEAGELRPGRADMSAAPS